MLGRTLTARLGAAGHEVLAADLPQWDVLDSAGFTSRCIDFNPGLIVHCAAMTNVDACQKDREAAFRLNEDGSLNVAVAARTVGARLFAISTDYVFSATPPSPRWAWSETDLPHPGCVYAESKLAGERVVGMLMPDSSVVLRTAWLYGPGGPSFVHTMARLAMECGDPVKVVDDQRGNPTSTEVVADAVGFLIAHPEVSGVVHATCENQCSWYDFAEEIFRLLGSTRRVVRCTTEEFPRAAPRPVNSALKKSVLNRLGYRTRDWREALADFISREFS